MIYASFSEEKKLWKKGYKYVVGLDEAGRGPLAGPVVAGAVIVCSGKRIFGRSDPPQNYGGGRTSRHQSFRDSKKLSPKQREEFYKLITRNKNIKWGVGIVSEKVIDKINILEATKLAMTLALKKLKADYLILDGNFSINYPLLQKSIIKADEKVFSCAAASIIAKVTRDRIMMRYHKKYPQYRFDKHKGYPTKYHYQMLNKHGPCQIHRKSYMLYK